MNLPARFFASTVAGLLAALFAGPAAAVDGVIEINQACAVNTGCVTGDAAGFPVDLFSANSYRLTSNLTVSGGATTAIRVSAGLIPGSTTIDLNGFSIRCFGVAGACGSGAGGMGIDAQISNVTVRNGAISDMGFHGMHLGDRCMVEDVRTSGNNMSGIVGGATCKVIGNVSDGNRQHGIAVTTHGLVQDNVVMESGQDGIEVGDFTAVVRNTVRDSAAFGIDGGDGNTIVHNTVIGSNLHGIILEPGEGCTVIGNTSRQNGPAGGGRVGLLMGDSCGYAHNVLTENNAGGVQVSGGIQTDANVCNGALCP